MSIPYLKVKGSPFDMGRRQGEAFREQIHELAEERLRLTMLVMESAGVDPDEGFCLETARSMLEVQEKWHPEVHREFIGIAEGAAIEPERLLIGNGYTDFRDVVVQRDPIDAGGECTALFALPEATETGRGYAAQTWDMHATAEPYIVIIEREPDRGPRTLSMTTTGCLSLVGVNDRGLAIGNNNLLPDDATIGVIYLAMIHAALQTTDFESAVNSIKTAPRASGHHYYIMDGTGQAVGIETTAKKYRQFEATDGVYVHANHYIDPSLAGKAGGASANSKGRHEKALSLLSKERGRLNPDGIKRLLENRDDLPHCICRHGSEEDVDPHQPIARTCAAAVLDPVGRGMWAVWGPPDKGTWEWYGLT